MYTHHFISYLVLRLKFCMRRAVEQLAYTVKIKLVVYKVVLWRNIRLTIVKMKDQLVTPVRLYTPIKTIFSSNDNCTFFIISWPEFNIPKVIYLKKKFFFKQDLESHVNHQVCKSSLSREIGIWSLLHEGRSLTLVA